MSLLLRKWRDSGKAEHTRFQKESCIERTSVVPSTLARHKSIISGQTSYSSGCTPISPAKDLSRSCPTGQQISNTLTTTPLLIEEIDGPSQDSVPTAPQGDAHIKYSPPIQACSPVGVQQKSTSILQPPCQKSSQRKPVNPGGSSHPLPIQSPSFSRQQSALGRLTNKQRYRNHRQLNMQHQFTQVHSYHHQHSVPVDNRRYSRDNPIQVLKLQQPPSSSEPSLAEEVTATDVMTGSKMKFNFLSSPLHVSHEATTSPALGDEILSTIREASCEQTPSPHIEREAQGGLPSSQRKSQTVSDQQLLLSSHSDNGRHTHPTNDDVISKCDDVTIIDSTKGSETITSSEQSSQEGSHALMPTKISSKFVNVRTMESDIFSNIMTSPPQDSAEHDTSDVCKTHLECSTSAPANEMLPADITLDPLQPSIYSTSAPHSQVTNLPATVDHCCQGHPPELENPSLDPTTGPILDQDKCEDSLTYSHETQILLPTSGPPVDPHNTREYIPTCFNPVATLSQCTHDGRRYYDEHNDFGLEIPAGAIPEGESITIDIGVALYGPFQYPEGLRPVSPVFWVCVRDKSDFKFLKPVKLTIPHCLDLKQYDDIESLGLSFLKGDHEMKPQQMYQFQPAEGDVLIEPLKTHAVIKITHFCSLCFSCKERRDLFEKEIFCLYSVIPYKISPDQLSDAYFFITLRLKTCLTTVQKQIKKLNLEEHKEEKEKFQFSNVQELEMFLPQSPPAEWRVGMRGKKKVV